MAVSSIRSLVQEGVKLANTTCKSLGSCNSCLVEQNECVWCSNVNACENIGSNCSSKVLNVDSCASKSEIHPYWWVPFTIVMVPVVILFTVTLLYTCCDVRCCRWMCEEGVEKVECI